MKDKVFLDTNIFVYMQSAIEIEKRDICMGIIDKYDCHTSTQVFNEVSNVMIKKLKMQISEVKQIITAIHNNCKVSLVNYETVQKALDINDRYNYSFYDSLILAAAIFSKCDYVFSEDLQDGQIIENTLKIVNILKSSCL